MLSFYINAFVNLFIIIDPIVVIPVFLALTQSETPQQRSQTALKACVISAIVLVAFGFLGRSEADLSAGFSRTGISRIGARRC